MLLRFILLVISTINLIYVDSSCPKYKCLSKSSRNYCLNISTDFLSKSSTGEMVPCPDNQFCAHEKQGWDKKKFWEEDSFIATCKDFKQPSLDTDRYPGETCYSDSQCWRGKCRDQKCEGNKEGDLVLDDIHCEAGLYMNIDTRRCEKVKQIGEECSDREYECVNTAFCYKNKCTAYYSLENGSDVSDPKMDVQDLTMCCKSAFVDRNSVCAELEYDDEPTSEGVVECELGDICNYKGSNGVDHQLQCQCGYNAEGKGYCPYDHKHNRQLWEGHVERMKSALDNHCHTNQRFTCRGYDFFDKVKKASYNELNVSFHNSLACASEVAIMKELRWDEDDSPFE